MTHIDRRFRVALVTILLGLPFATPAPAPSIIPDTATQLIPVAPTAQPRTPGTSISPLLWVVLGVALGLGAAGGISTARTPRTVPSIALSPYPDADMNVRVSMDGSLMRSELSLRACVDAGRQVLQAPGPVGIIEVSEAR